MHLNPLVEGVTAVTPLCGVNNVVMDRIAHRPLTAPTIRRAVVDECEDLFLQDVLV